MTTNFEISNFEISDFAIRTVSAEEASSRIDELVEVLRDSIAHGASMNFLAHVTDEELRAFWRGSIADQAAGRRLLIVADLDGRIAGTAMLIFAQQQNSPYRAEVGKMIVHSACRRRHLGVRLLEAIEAAALANGRTLLLLDTESGSAGEHLYAARGWTRFGIVPGHAMTPDGVPKPTSFFYKVLADAPVGLPLSGSTSGDVP